MTGRRRARRRLVMGATVLAIATVIAVLGRDAPARFLVVEDPLAVSDAIVVMAGDPDYERTTAAVALLRSGGAQTLILTGGEEGPGDSAQSLRAKALELGAAPERIRVETISHSTRAAVLAVAPIVQALDARTVTLVTSPYHERRASAAARRAWPGVIVRSHPAASSLWSPHGWWRSAHGRRIVVTEYLKLLYYGCRGWV